MNDSPDINAGELRKLQEELEQVKQELHTVRALSDATFEAVVFSENGHIVDVNARFTFMFGYTREEALGMPVSLLQAPEDCERVMKAVMSDEEVVSEYRNVRKNGSTLFVEAHGRVVLRGGRKLRVTAIRDITARREAEQVLKESETRFRGFFENNVVGMVQSSADGRMRVVNDTFCRMLGYSREELVGRHALDITHPDDRAPNAREIRRAVSGEIDGFTIEKRYLRKDGSTLWVCLAVTEIRADEGSPGYALAMIQDISERKAAEQALKRANEFLSIAQHSAGIGSWDLDLQNGSLIWSERLFELFGLDPTTQPTFEQWITALHPGDQTIIREAFDRSKREGVSLDIECRVDRPDGRLPWIAVLGRTSYDESGRPTRMMGVCRDITKRKQVERALQESQERFLKAFHSSPVGLAITRLADGRVLDANNSILQLFGFSRDELIGRTTQELGFFSPQEPRSDVIERMQKRGPTPGIEKEMRTRAGNTIWVLASAQKLYAAGEECLICTAIDITDRKKAEEALRMSEQRLSWALQAGRGGAWDLDLIRGAAWWSPELHDVIGVSCRETPDFDKAFVNVLAEDRETAKDSLNSAIAAGTDYECEFRLMHPELGQRWLASHGRPSLDESGQPIRMVGITLDITERKKAEEAIARAKDAAEEAGRAKDQFLAVLSHELRTPLTPALTAVSLMQNNEMLPSDVRTDLAMVHRNIDLEVRLIDDLLDVSRIAAGKLNLEKRPVDVAETIYEAAAIVADELRAKRQVLDIRVPGTPYVTLGDGPRLQQVFWNLLRNAIKFTPAGGRIFVQANIVPSGKCPLPDKPCRIFLDDCPQVSRQGNEPLGGEVVVELTDAGCGISQDLLPRLFNAFEQGQGARTFGGMGLGLSICKAVVELHGGNISAWSKGPGQGSTFTVRLPISLCSLAVAAISPSKDKAHVIAVSRVPVTRFKILVVEDHVDTAGMMSRLLESDGHEVTIADGFASALEAAMNGDFDLLISDIGLPDGTGYDLITRLIAEGKRTPAIALSGYGTSSDIEKSKAAGFVEHITKPISDVDVLLETVQRVAAGK